MNNLQISNLVLLLIERGIGFINKQKIWINQHGKSGAVNLFKELKILMPATYDFSIEKNGTIATKLQKLHEHFLMKSLRKD